MTGSNYCHVKPKALYDVLLRVSINLNDIYLYQGDYVFTHVHLFVGWIYQQGNTKTTEQIIMATADVLCRSGEYTLMQIVDP